MTARFADIDRLRELIPGDAFAQWSDEEIESAWARFSNAQAAVWVLVDEESVEDLEEFLLNEALS